MYNIKIIFLDAKSHHVVCVLKVPFSSPAVAVLRAGNIHFPRMGKSESCVGVLKLCP